MLYRWNCLSHNIKSRFVFLNNSGSLFYSYIVVCPIDYYDDLDLMVLFLPPNDEFAYEWKNILFLVFVVM